MPYIADMKKATAFKEAGQLVGNGQCVTLVHAVVYIPPDITLGARGSCYGRPQHSAGHSDRHI